MKKLLFTSLFLFLAITLVAREDIDFFKENEIIQTMLKQSVESFKAKDYEGARQLASEAYFQHFEYMEGAIGRNIGRKGFLMERKFTNLRALYTKAIKGEEVPLKRVEALLDGLFFDLDEVTPVIQHGFRLKAEAEDPNYDKEAAVKSAEEAQRKAAQEAAEMFGLTLDESGKASTEATTVASNDATQSDESNASAGLDALQAAANLNPKLQFLFDQISDNVDSVIKLAKEGKGEEAADLLASMREGLYMNSKLEIEINKIKNLNMRVKLRGIGKEIRQGEITEKQMRERFEVYLDEIFSTMQAIGVTSISEIKVEGYDDKATKSADYSKVADDIKISTKNILRNLESRGAKASIDDLQSTYLDIFEASGMESKIGAVDSGLKLAIEAEFSRGVALIKAGKPASEVEACFNKLNDLITGALDKIGDTSPLFLFIASLTIILREGLEALIIVVAIISYIIQSGNKNRLNIAYSALWSGILLSFITAFFVSYVIRANAGQSRELIEGVTMLIAVALLFYVGFWLLSNAHNVRYAKHMQEQAREAISKGSARTLWWTVFLAVFREGAETILFYQALIFDASTNSEMSAVFGGLIVGMVILVVLYYLLKAGAVRIPVKQFFLVTSYIIFYMCFVFAGKGIVELVEGKLITPHLFFIEFSPVTWLGLHPYYESLILQAIILAALVFGIIYMSKVKSKKGALSK